ncbi:MAG: hypothetical protein E7607_02505 [Ruminococcaceae bacterium]|nr:hypothetical protein [Oscillospiraceae bacterium]
MFCIRMADLVFGIDNKYEYVKKLCRDYVVESDKPCMTVSVTDEQIKAEMEISEFAVNPAYAEGVCVYRNICEHLPERFGAFLMHCAVIEYEGEGYAFAAQSGTGKSTHIALWQKRFGENVRIINGDKPIMRFCGDSLFAYGTPWCGKEGYSSNASVPIKAICFIERATENSIRKISASDALTRIFHQILTPDTAEGIDALFPLIDRMLGEIPCYVLGCNISEEAAEVAYDGMNN